jgi:signal peptidase I
MRSARELVVTLIVAVGLAFVVRTYGVETYVVEGVSMLPTFNNEEHVLVNKLAYVLGPPKDGQIIVFHPPVPDDTIPFIKRIVATPGQTVSIRSGYLYVDGKKVPQPYIEYWDPSSFDATHPVKVPPGHVFVLGDNRPVAEDSRYFGMVPIGSIVGQVVFAFWPLSRLGAVGQPQPGARGYTR